MEVSRSSGDLVLNMRGGVRLSLPASLSQATTYIVLEQDDWFEDEVRFIRRWLGPGMRAVDIGANLGVYTVPMAKAVQPSGQVWAFEPAPTSADFLQKTIELNDCAPVIVHRAAVSDRSGSIDFLLTPHSELNAVAAGRAAAGTVMSLPAITLDDACAMYWWKDIDFVKIDVEGHEVQAIRGGLQFFGSQSPLVMVEIRTGTRVDLTVLDLLREIGYAPYVLLPGSLTLTTFDPSSVDAYQLNVFACKPDRAERLARAGFLAEGSLAAPDCGSEAWVDYARSAPYAREFAAGWASRAGFFAALDTKAYFQGLYAFARSLDRSISAAERLGFLGHAFTCLGEAVAGEDSLARWMSYARVAYEMGRRGAAVEAFVRIHERVIKEPGQSPALPFLAPSARYEELAMSGRPGDWLRCALTEQVEKLRGHSSMYMEGTSLPLIEPILDLSFCSAEMQRRWQLVRLATGTQTAPQPSPLLCQRSEENLNPEFWRTTAAA